MMFQDNNPGDQWHKARRHFQTVLSNMVWLMLLMFSATVHAAQITVSTDRSDIALDENFQVIFSVDGDVAGEPDFSVLEKDFDVLGSSKSTSISIVNGKTSRSTRYLVNVLPHRSGVLTIPSVSFGGDTSPELVVKVRDAGAAGSSAGDPGAPVYIEVSVDQDAPYVQQQVILTVKIYSSIKWRDGSLSEPEFSSGEVLMQKLGEDAQYSKQMNNKTWQVIERHYALFPQQSGEIRMKPLVLDVRIPAGRKKRRSPFGSFNDPFFGDFFSGQSYRNKVIRSKALSLKVRPMPSGFDGARWLVAREIRLEENWSKALDALNTGEPVTRTLAIVADGVTLGQLPDLQMGDVDGLRIYPDDPVTSEQATSAGVLSTSSRKFAVIPVQPGTYHLPEVEVKWWNSTTDREEVARIPARTLRVAGSAQQAQVVPSRDSGMRLKTPGEHLPAQESPGEKKTETAVAATAIPAGVNRWLLAGMLLFLLLWLVTLFAWLRNRRRPAPAGSSRPMRVDTGVDYSAAWKALRDAAEAGDALAMRRALLQVAGSIWPDQPPRSLEAMADRAEATLSEQLLALSRALYAGDASSWDGSLIEQQLKTLRGETKRARQEEDQSPLKPLYPNSMS